jgi:hypothetical protein
MQSAQRSSPDLKMIGCATLAVLMAGVATETVFAHEPGDFQQYIRGFTIGDPLGATPPPGLYFENTSLYVPSAPGQGQLGAYKANALLDTPTLFWSTGYNFLGASVGAAISQPFFQVGVSSGSAAGPPYGGTTLYPTVHNTWVNPLMLSWNLGGGLFASTAFDFYIPDGSRYDGTLNPDYWTFQPRASLSYLANGWDLTGTFLYDFNTASAGHTGPFAGTPAAAFGVGYQSGDQAFLDVTATKKFGKWEIGPVGYFAWQTTNDTPGGGFSCAAMGAATAGLATCGRATDYAVGGLVGYDFGPVALKFTVTDSVHTRDDFGGLFVWTKLSFRLWGPDAPSSPMKGLITK